MNLIPDPREHARIVAEMMQRAAELNGSAEIANIKMHREQLAVVVAALRQYAEATPPEALIPEGWKLVPIEPSEEMVKRMEDCSAEPGPNPDGIGWEEWHRRRWVWILEATPSPLVTHQEKK